MQSKNSVKRVPRPMPGGIRLTVVERCEIEDWCHACVVDAEATAVTVELERCAVLCESTPRADDMHCCAHMAATLAAKIRA